MFNLDLWATSCDLIRRNTMVSSGGLLPDPRVVWVVRTYTQAAWAEGSPGTLWAAMVPGWPARTSCTWDGPTVLCGQIAV